MLTDRSRHALAATARRAREHFPREVPDGRVVAGLLAAWAEHVLPAEHVAAAGELAREVLREMSAGCPIP